MKQRLFFTLATVGLLLLAISGTLHAKDVLYQYCLAGGIYDEATGNCKVAIKMEFNYPAWVSDSVAFLWPVLDILLSEQREYIQRIDQIFTLEESSSYLVFKYEEFAHGDSLRSVVFTVESYTGGIRPLLVFHSLTFDIHEERVMTWEDLFMPDADIIAVLQPLVENDLKSQLEEVANSNDISISGIDEMSDYQIWALDDGSLVFYFEPYTVTDLTRDGFAVSIPLAELSDIVNPALLLEEQQDE